MLLAFSDFGINHFITQRLSTHREELKDLFSNALSFKLLFLILYPLLMMLVGMSLGYSGDNVFLLVILSFFQALLQFIYFFRANFQASQFFAIDSFASMADKIILIVVVLILMTNKLTLESFIYGRLLAIVIAFFLLYLVIIKCYGWIKPGFSFGWIKKIIAFSWPFALIGALHGINEKVDQVMIERIKGPEEAGLYAGAYRWFDAFMMYVWIIMPIFFAKFSFHKEDKQESEKIFNSGQIISAVPLIFVASFVFFYGDKLFFQLTNSSTEELKTMTLTLKILFISMLLNGFFSIYSTLMNSTGYVKIMSILVLISIIINVILNAMYIPQYGAVAASLATVASTFFSSIAAIVLVRIKKSVRIPFVILLKLFIVFSICLSCFYCLSIFNIAWYLITIINGLVVLVACYFLGFKKYLF